MAGLRKLRGKYYVRVFLPGGKEKLLPTKTGDKKRAEAFKRQVEEREFLVKARLAEDVGKSNTMLRDAATEYLKDCQSRLREETYLNYELALRNLIICWGNIDVCQITAAHFTNIRQWLRARVSVTSTNIRLGAIRTFLNWIVATNKLEKLPGKLTLIKVDEELPKFFTPDELDHIFAEITDPQMKATIRLLAETGLRRSELFKCNLEHGYLHLRHTKGRRDRLVFLPPELIPDFYIATESPYHVDSIGRVFRKAMISAGIEPKGRSLHSLRHTFALREYYRSGDIYLVRTLLGHSTVNITERYLKFPEEYLREVFGDRVQRFPAHLNPGDLQLNQLAFKA